MLSRISRAAFSGAGNAEHAMAQHAVDVHAERDVLSRQMPKPAAIGMNAATDILDLPADQPRASPKTSSSSCG
jgi:hypothetical protein